MSQDTAVIIVQFIMLGLIAALIWYVTGGRPES